MLGAKKTTEVASASSLLPNPSRHTKMGTASGTQPVPKRPVNYANYTKEKYNILTLQQHNPYYQSFQQNVAAYKPEQPDWSKSLYKQKHNPITQYNYILYRNIRGLRAGQRKNSLGTSVTFVEAEGPKLKGERNKSMAHILKTKAQPEQDGSRSSLPVILKRAQGKAKRISKVEELRKRSLSSYCGSQSGRKDRSRLQANPYSNRTLEPMQQVQRAERAGQFIRSLDAETAKQAAALYAQELMAKVPISDLTREQIRLAIEQPVMRIGQLIAQSASANAMVQPQSEQEQKEDDRAEVVTKGRTGLGMKDAVAEKNSAEGTQEPLATKEDKKEAKHEGNRSLDPQAAAEAE